MNLQLIYLYYLSLSKNEKLICKKTLEETKKTKAKWPQKKAKKKNVWWGSKPHTINM